MARHGKKTRELSGWERLAHRLGTAANSPGAGQRLQYLVLRGLSYRWVRASNLGASASSSMASMNSHSSPSAASCWSPTTGRFFDSFAILLAMVHAPVAWTKTLLLPGALEFFLRLAAGIAGQPWASAAARCTLRFSATRSGARSTTRRSITWTELLKQVQGNVVGIHPEGTRGNRGADPYELLPAQPGVGKIALLAKPMVVPGFINGLGNNIVDDIRRHLRPRRRGARRAIVSVFGAPVNYSALAAEKPRPTLYKKCADLFMAEVKKLSVRERELRADVMAGRIPDDDPRWIDNWGASKLYAFEA